MSGKTKLVIVILIFLCISVDFTSSTSATTNETKTTQIVVQKTLYVGGIGPENYSKIQDAIDNASNGDRVFVYDDSAPYYENLKINKSIHLIGENKETIIIQNNSVPCISLCADEIILKGFTIQSDTLMGIYGYKINSCVISNNTIIAASRNIYLISSSNNEIYNNYLCDTCEISLQLENSNENTVHDNLMIGSQGINFFLMDCQNNKIFRNSISESNRGIYLINCFYNLIFDNNFFENIVCLEFRNCSYNLVLRNYWDNWNLLLPRPIKRTRAWLLLQIETQWYFFDWLPRIRPIQICLDEESVL